MILKKSNILLIVIAIFLLISIGSVCAKENITDDSDVQLADDGTDVVLSNSDTEENVADDTQTEKINTTIETDKDKYEFKQDSNKTISVTVKDNKTDNINVNKSDLSVLNGNKSISFDYTNSFITIKEALPVGNYNLTINYLGSETYINSTKVIALKVYGNNTIETVTSVVCNGKNIEIPVKVYDQVEYIKLIKDNFNLTLVYTNETGNISNLTITEFDIVNDTIKFNTTVAWITAKLKIEYANATEAKTVDIKVSSEVKAQKDEYKFKSEENKTISITILGAQENPLNVTKNDLKVFDNGKEITDFKYNNTNLTLNLGVGVHNVTVIYNGNSTYGSSNKTVTVKVSGNQTMKPQESASIDSANKVNITINLSDGADPVKVDISKLNLTLFYTVGNQTFNKTISGVILADDNQTVIFEVTDKFDTAYIDIKYAAENNLTGKTTLKVGSEIDATPDVINKGVGEVINFTVEVKLSNGTLINVTDKNIKVLNNGKNVNFTCNNSVVTLTEKLNYGSYNLTVQYIGSETYATAEKIIALTVYGINATSPVNVNSTKKGEVKINIVNGNGNITISKDDLTLNVTYKDGNDTKVIAITDYKVENGTLYFTLENGNFTAATLNIKYNNTEANVTLNRIYNVKIIPINVANDYQDGNFTFQLVDADTGDILSNRTVSVSMKQAGTNGTQIYFITKSSSGGYNLGTSTTLTSDENGIISLKNQNFYPGLVLSDAIYAPVGDYIMTISGSGLLKGENKTNITINKIDVNVVLETFNEYYGTDKKVTIKVTNAKTGKALAGVYVLLNITGATLSSPRQLTDVNGTIQLGVTGLPTNTYQMAFESNDTNLNTSKGSGSFTIKKIPITITAKNVSIYYNSGATATIKITDKRTGKALRNAYVIIQIDNSKTAYALITDKNGKASFSASLKVGKHTYKILNVFGIEERDNNGTKSSVLTDIYQYSAVTKTITVKKATGKFSAKKLSTYYRSGKYFTAKLTNTKNKKAIFNAKVKLQIYNSKLKYKPIKTYTDMSGKINLLLDGLAPGSYKIVVSCADSKDYTAKKITSKIVVKKSPTKLIPKKLTAKKGAKKYFKVTVKNKKTKKVIKGVKVKIKVYTGKKAKTYKVKTDSKGVAKLLVNKLKVGKHKVVVSSGDKYCVAKKAKSTIKIKK